MDASIRILIVDDSENDTVLLLDQLRGSGYDPTFERVDTPEAMHAALDQQPWDLILADYAMPRFSGAAALSLMRQRGLDVPFILVSGVVDEEKAVTMMRAGAHDYIEKGNLTRSAPAIERELRAAAVRSRRCQAEQALRVSEARFRASEARFHATEARFRAHRQEAMENEARLRTVWERERGVVETLQRSLVPRALPAVPEVEFGHGYWPACQHERVGGDFYDVVPLDAHRLAFAIGDVSGKGSEAALCTAMARNIWRGFLVEDPRQETLMERLNNALVRYMEGEQFVTMLCGLIDRRTGELRYVVAGHPPPLLRRASGRGGCEALPGRGMVLGVFPDMRYETQETRLGVGDLLLLYTDGMSELRRHRELLEVEALRDWLRDCPAEAPGEVVRLLYERAREWSGDPFRDDIALVAIRCRQLAALPEGAALP